MRIASNDAVGRIDTSVALAWTPPTASCTHPTSQGGNHSTTTRDCHLSWQGGARQTTCAPAGRPSRTTQYHAVRTGRAAGKAPARTRTKQQQCTLTRSGIGRCPAVRRPGCCTRSPRQPQAAPGSHKQPQAATGSPRQPQAANSFVGQPLNTKSRATPLRAPGRRWRRWPQRGWRCFEMRRPWGVA